MDDEQQQSRYVVVGVTAGQGDAVVLNAARFAHQFTASLVCANVDTGSYVVQEHPDGSVTSLPIDPDLPELTSTIFDDQLADHIRGIVNERGVEVIFRELAGDPARALARLADALRAELIVVGSRHRGMRPGIQEFFGGSVAAHLAHRQQRPVVVIPLAPVSEGDRLPWEGHDAS